jgi:hypothetical protein
MEIMKQLTCVKTIGPIMATFFSAAPLWAATAAQDDNSDLFVWIFLAFCALVVVAQLIPAILMLLGFAKGVKKEPAQPAPGPADQT